MKSWLIKRHQQKLKEEIDRIMQNKYENVAILLSALPMNKLIELRHSLTKCINVLEVADLQILLALVRDVESQKKKKK